MGLILKPVPTLRNWFREYAKTKPFVPVLKEDCNVEMKLILSKWSLIVVGFTLFGLGDSTTDSILKTISKKLK